MFCFCPLAASRGRGRKVKKTYSTVVPRHVHSSQNYLGKRPQTVCVRSVSRKSRDLESRRIGVQRGDGGDEVNLGVSECG